MLKERIPEQIVVEKEKIMEESVPRHSFMLELDGSQVFITDFGGVNPVLINGFSFGSVKKELRDGNTLKVGDLTFDVSIQS